MKRSYPEVFFEVFNDIWSSAFNVHMKVSLLKSVCVCRCAYVDVCLSMPLSVLADTANGTIDLEA